MEQITEFTELRPWGTNIAALYDDFIKEITSGNLPGVTIDDVRQIEKEIGLNAAI